MNELKEINKSFFPVLCELASTSLEEWSHLLCFTPNNEFLLEQTFSDPDFDPELFLGVFCEGKLIAAVLGIIRKWKSPSTAFIKFIILDENQRQEETGRELLAEIEKRLRQKGADKIYFGSASPYYLFPGIYIDDNSLRSLLASYGWQESSERISRVIDTQNMSITESTLKELLSSKHNCIKNQNIKLENDAQDAQKDISNKNALVHSDSVISLAANNERNEVLGFIETEFSQSWAKETESAFIPEHPAFCSIARDSKGKIIGFATIHSCNPNWFGPMGVKKKLRKGGIGRLLLCHSVLHAKDQGTKKLLLPWINDKDAFYCNIIGDMEKHTYFKCCK